MLPSANYSNPFWKFIRGVSSLQLDLEKRQREWKIQNVVGGAVSSTAKNGECGGLFVHFLFSSALSSGLLLIILCISFENFCTPESLLNMLLFDG